MVRWKPPIQWGFETHLLLILNAILGMTLSLHLVEPSFSILDDPK
jgi:hypothetical protein